VEAIGEPVSLVRSDLFLVGVSVTCSRAVSAVRGRIGEGGRSERGGFKFESGSEGVSAIIGIRGANGRPRELKMAVIPDLVPSVASTVLPDGVRVERKGVHKWRRLHATLSQPATTPCLEIPARRTFSLLSVRSCCFVFDAFQPFVPH